MAEHVSLKADLYDSKYRTLGRSVPEDRWAEIVDRAQFELPRPVEDYLGGSLVPASGGMRQLNAAAAVDPVFLACLGECAVERQASQSAGFWGGLLSASYGDLGGLWERLGGDGTPGFLTYQGLLGTVGLGGGRVAALPWWMGDARHQNGVFAKGSTAALLSPASVSALARGLRGHQVLATVKHFFEESCPDPAAIPTIVEEHQRLVTFLESAVLRADWVLGWE
ncbi:MAG: hypothetical protein U0359_38850 [Byssovorax sp.]